MMMVGDRARVGMTYCGLVAFAVVGACGGRGEDAAAPARERALVVVRGELLAADPDLIARVAVGSDGIAPFAHSRREVALWSAPEPALWMTTIFGTTPEFFRIRRWSAARGDLFDDGAGEVAVLGQTVARQLFDTNDPIGQSIQIRGRPFRVIGVLTARGPTPVDLDEDDSVYLPLASYERHVGAPRGNLFAGAVLVAAAPEAVGRLSVAIRDALRAHHRLAVGAADDFRIEELSELRVAP